MTGSRNIDVHFKVKMVYSYYTIVTNARWSLMTGASIREAVVYLLTFWTHLSPTI